MLISGFSHDAVDLWKPELRHEPRGRLRGHLGGQAFEAPPRRGLQPLRGAREAREHLQHLPQQEARIPRPEVRI